MSVASNNPFQLLGVDGAEDVPSQQASSQAAAKKPQQPQQQRYVPGAPRQSAPKSAPAPMDEEPPLLEQRDSRAERRSRGDRGRGGRGGRGSQRGRGRRFDRHSGTGREETAKSQRQGWGGTDGASAVKLEKDSKEDAKEDAEEFAKEDAADVKAEKEAQQPVQDNTLTLDEYLKSQAEKRPQLAASAPRTVQEDESYGQRLERGEGESYFAGQEKKSQAPRPRKEKQLVEIDLPSYASESTPSTRGSGRGGRGGARGGRGGRGAGRGGNRGERSNRSRGGRQGPVVNLADEQAFPSLS